jgi:Fe-S-cluster containining protein
MPQTLIQIVDAALTSATLRSGHHLACRPGCYQCCIGVFPIPHEDAARLRAGLTALEHTDPEKAARIHTRVQQSLTRLDPWFPGDLTTGILFEDYEAAILFEEFANDEPCPVLDPSTGTCDLYASRPILCRTFGPPMRTPGDDGETKRSPPANSTPPSPPSKPPATKPSTPPTTSTAKPSSPTPSANPELHPTKTIPTRTRLRQPHRR